MTVAIISNGVLGSVAVKTAAMKLTPSYGQASRRATGAYFRPGWDRHVEEVEGRTPAYGNALLCDMPGAPPCDKGSVTSAFAGFGKLNGLGSPVALLTTPASSLFCSDFGKVLGQIQALLGEAEASGLSNMMAAQKAQAFVDRFSGFFAKPVLAGPCERETAVAKATYNALATMLANSNPGTGAPALYAPEDLVPPSGSSDLQGTIKTVAIAAAIIAGVVVVAPIVWRVVRS